MAAPGSSLVFTTGIEAIDFTVKRSITRLRLSTVTWDYLNRIARVRIEKGFIDPETSAEKFVAVVESYPIDNVSAATSRSIDGKTHLVPSGAHFDLLEAKLSGEKLGEALEDAVFDRFEKMKYFSGVETPP